MKNVELNKLINKNMKEDVLGNSKQRKEFQTPTLIDKQ